MNEKTPFNKIMFQYFDVLLSRVHVLGPAANVAGTTPVGIELAEVLRGLSSASHQCPGAILLRPGSEVCCRLLARLYELVADMDDSRFAKALFHVADLKWAPGTHLHAQWLGLHLKLCLIPGMWLPNRRNSG